MHKYKIWINIIAKINIFNSWNKIFNYKIRLIYSIISSSERHDVVYETISNEEIIMN